MNKTVKECLSSEKNEEVVVIGILCNPTDGVTKTGKPYADFDLYANGSTIQLKVWDMTSKEFLDRKGVSIGKPVTVNGTISVNPLNGVKQICVRDGEIPAAAPYSVPGEAVEDTVEKLVQATPVPVGKMLESVKALAANYFPQPEEGQSEGLRGILRKLCNWGLGMLEGDKHFPYGSDVHKERSGLVAHIYNCAYMLTYLKGVPDFDKGVVLTALLTYRLGVLFIYSVDNATGLIKETVPLEEYGSIGSYCSQFVTSWSGCLVQVLGNVDPAIRNYMACLNALNGVAEPVTVEAQIARGIASMELESFRIYEAVNGRKYTDPGFVRGIDGNVRTVYNFKDQ